MQDRNEHSPEEVKWFWKEFNSKVDEFRSRFPGWRLGQVLYHSLCVVRPTLAMDIAKTDKDPFYASDENDPRVSEFYEYLFRQVGKDV